MKKTALILALGAALGGMNVANAGVLAAGSNGTITVNTGCFTFGTCAVNGDADDITDNALTVTGTSGGVTGVVVGSGIAGDGKRGIFNFVVGADGNSFSLTSYNLDSYTGTAGGTFATRMVNTSAARGTIAADGTMTLDLTGRTGMAFTYRTSIGEQAWNRDTHGAAQTGCPGTGLYTPFTTGTMTAYDCADGTTVAAQVTGSALVSSIGAGLAYTGTGTIVSAGNVGNAWGFFDGNPYTEVYNVTVTGTAVPVPAAVWLLGSGLLGLVGVARRKKA